MRASAGLLLVVVMVTHVMVTSAIRCYDCDTSRRGDCGDKFDDDKAKNHCSNGGVCRKTITDSRGNLACRTDYSVCFQGRVCVSSTDALVLG